MINSKKNGWIIFLLLLPILILYTITLIAPSLSTLPFSFFKWNMLGTPKFIEFRNYIYMFKDSIFHTAIINNLFVMVVYNLLVMPISFSLAVLLRRKFRGNVFFKTIIFIPIVIAPLIVSLVWGFMLAPKTGLINLLLNQIGLEKLALNWLGGGFLSMFIICVILTWSGVGFNMVIILAGIRSIDKDLFEAAEIDGANPIQRALHITLPLSREQIFICVILNTVGSLKIFELVYFLTRGGPANTTQLLSTYMFKVGFQSSNYGYGMTVAVVILVLGLVMSYISIKIFHRGK